MDVSTTAASLNWLAPFEATAFTAWGTPTSWLELVAVGLAVWMVLCNLRVNPLGWPLAMASSLLYFGLFWRHRLYGDASLQLVFVTLAGWGWWQWLRGRQPDGGRLQVRMLGRRGRLLAVALTLVAWPALGWFLQRFTDTDVPYWDAFPTAASLVGQWLLGRKFVENWLVWLVVNVVSVALFAHKGLWLTMALYMFFVGMSWAGWRAWQRQAARP